MSKRSKRALRIPSLEKMESNQTLSFSKKTGSGLKNLESCFIPLSLSITLPTEEISMDIMYSVLFVQGFQKHLQFAREIKVKNTSKIKV